MEEVDEALMVVAETYCRYKSPAYYDDVLTIMLMASEVRSRSLRFVYKVYRRADDTLIAEGETLHVVTDNNKKVKTLPEAYRKRFLGDDADLAPAVRPQR